MIQESRATRRRAQAWFLSSLCLAAVCLPIAARAACTQWNVNGKWVFVQGNDTRIHVTLEQTTGGLKGYANYSKTVEEDYCIGVSCDHQVNVSGPIVGTIEGNAFEATVYWGGDSIGVYTGTVGAQGLLVGTTYDAKAPATRTDWHSTSTASCLQSAAPPPAAPPPVPRPPVRITEAPDGQFNDRRGSNPPGSALGTVAAPKLLGRAPVTTLASASPSICDMARSARTRNSPAAPGLEAQCKAQPAPVARPILDEAWRSEHAARGEALANEDSLALELRNVMSEGAARRGFDYGMAAAEGHTAPGPGKQAVQDALSPDERLGFQLAVQFSLDRNASAGLAAKGAAIASADPELAAIRASSAEATARISGAADAAVFYKLGFDVATAIFGDPALGALGNTATGPGSMRIRGRLSPGTQQSGFDDAMVFHLRHDYR